MLKKEGRFRLLPEGALEVIDPSLRDLPLLKALDPTFQIACQPLEGFEQPRIVATRRMDSGLSVKELRQEKTRRLGAVHRRLMRKMRRGRLGAIDDGAVSLLDLKIELARRALARCRLCAHRCGVDRLAGPAGACGLGTSAYVGEHFLHIAEEAPINPAYVFNLQGCGLRCRYCQQYQLLPIRPKKGLALTPALWAQVALEGARSLSFVGGNPDESLYPILQFLKGAPSNVPIVWNNHAYGQRLVYQLLEGVVDVYIPDFKYGKPSCGQKWSGVEAYPQTAQRAVRAMVDQGVPVFVRLLVLPGHFECCHRPVLHWLARYKNRLRLHVLDQYAPDFAITSKDGPMAHRPLEKDIEVVTAQARRLGLDVFNAQGAPSPQKAVHTNPFPL